MHTPGGALIKFLKHCTVCIILGNVGKLFTIRLLKAAIEAEVGLLALKKLIN